MQGWQGALLVITSIFVGMWIPVSMQLFVTLRSGRRFLQTMSSRGEQTLAELSSTVAALNQTIADVREVTHAAAQIKDSIRALSSIGAAVVPAVIALVRALREPGTETEGTETEEAGGNGASVPTGRKTPGEKESTS